MRICRYFVALTTHQFTKPNSSLSVLFIVPFVSLTRLSISLTDGFQRRNAVLLDRRFRLVDEPVGDQISLGFCWCFGSVK